MRGNAVFWLIGLLAALLGVFALYWFRFRNPAKLPPEGGIMGGSGSPGPGAEKPERGAANEPAPDFTVINPAENAAYGSQLLSMYPDLFDDSRPGRKFSECLRRSGGDYAEAEKCFCRQQQALGDPLKHPVCRGKKRRDNR